MAAVVRLLFVDPYAAAFDHDMTTLQLDKAPILFKRAVWENLEAVIAGEQQVSPTKVVCIGRYNDELLCGIHEGLGCLVVSFQKRCNPDKLQVSRSRIVIIYLCSFNRTDKAIRCPRKYCILRNQTPRALNM
ncbi:hypothetical protein ASD46_25415 [Rhizobium sp. Root491]|nr:hypothetical protein ASD46_25415 [Rhizobium sp. Root491]